ncbi:glucosaminidase domain-containing protein [Ktedonobacter racemifer]|uniref:Mannosyl-glycoprotein endo-beta-N-acetylglucosamidase-like domain-containing protein n=1 Tax=Ktedonobacter racemifer DSM 44963 TaxID=485913 RepID=D6TH59_KTERA|nr:glucosaminidase domain-containing protein [Ktedonobacter racemifer]EFH90801.1 hypothetical protein Krac_12440 [Ktedonobacter racemifer DSM 44963]
MQKTLLTLLLILVAGGCVYAWAGTQQNTIPTTFAASHTVTVSTSDTITRSPTISAAFIDRVLMAAGSPAQGIGQTMYDQGVAYGIDPVFALAFFHHESTFGLRGVSVVTLSIGNIRCTEGWRCDPSGGYRAYSSWRASVADWYTLMKTVYIADGRTTVATIIPKYAPQRDNNDEAAYIQSVMADVIRWRGGQI